MVNGEIVLGHVVVAGFVLDALDEVGQPDPPQADCRRAAHVMTPMSPEGWMIRLDIGSKAACSSVVSKRMRCTAEHAIVGPCGVGALSQLIGVSLRDWCFRRTPAAQGNQRRSGELAIIAPLPPSERIVASAK